MIPPDRANRPTRLSFALLAYLLGIIAVVTLLPFRFHWPSQFEFLLWDGWFDVAANVCLFLPLGFLHQLTRKRDGAPWGAPAALFGGTVSLVIELAQLGLSGRYSSPTDVLANTLGAWIGAVLHTCVERHLNRRLVGQLALELPLMTLFYLLLPLLWLNGINASSDASRLWLALLPGLCGGSVLAAVWRYRLRPAGVLSANALALIVALWFLIGTLPALLKRPWFLVLCSVGLALVVRLQLMFPRLIGRHERRFELSALRRIWPLYAAYVCLVALWPWPWVLSPWHAGLGFAEIADIPQVLPTFQVLEYIAAFTLLGYMVAEFRGRRDEPFSITVRWLLVCGVVVSGLLELIRGFHPQQVASPVHMLLATGVMLYGGVLYQLQLATVQQLLAVHPATPDQSLKVHMP